MFILQDLRRLRDILAEIIEPKLLKVLSLPFHRRLCVATGALPVGPVGTPTTLVLAGDRPISSSLSVIRQLPTEPQCVLEKYQSGKVLIKSEKILPSWMKSAFGINF